MSGLPRYVDWDELLDAPAVESITTTRHRVRWLLALFGLGLVIVFCRAAQLEISDGENFRRLAVTPREREVTLAAARGRIFARDGTVLAGDRTATALAVQFRRLQNPPDEAWVARVARARLKPSERRDPARLAAAQQHVRQELGALNRRLAALCEMPMDQWQSRAMAVQRRVELLAERVNARRLDRYQQSAAADDAAELTLWSIIAGLFAPPEPLPPAPVTVEEQTAYQVMVGDVSPEVADEIRSHAPEYPGVKLLEYTLRDYPHGNLAANLVGHVSASQPQAAQRSAAEPVSGLMGLERRFDAALQGRGGIEIQSVDQRGTFLSSRRVREPAAGADVVLSIDPALENFAEQLLDRAVHGPQTGAAAKGPPGGAIVVMDVHSGEILAAASAPRFDPNWFARADARVAGVLNDSRRPMFDRVARMAIPPGSVFKTATALALLASDSFDPDAPFECRGYLDETDRMRCQVFRQQGVGHGDVTLETALAQSCNVYFFDRVAQLGAVPLLDWAARLGFGQPTHSGLPDEAAGQLPQLDHLRQAQAAQMLSIGQGALSATPLQVVRMYAAIANGGYLIEPRLILKSAQPRGRHVPSDASSQCTDATRIKDLTPEALAVTRQGLRRVVDDPNGTAHAALRGLWPAVAGKTGTAETGGGQADHGWFAGYTPAEEPRFAFVVVLEHGGSGADAARLAGNLIGRMRQLGYFGSPRMATQPIPPGKG